MKRHRPARRMCRSAARPAGAAVDGPVGGRPRPRPPPPPFESPRLRGTAFFDGFGPDVIDRIRLSHKITE